MNGPEVYGDVFALGPGKKDVNIIWAGSDDGLINVTRDGGKTWTNVTPKDMPDFGRVSIIDASAFDPGARLRRGEEAAARRLRARTSSARTTSARPGRRSSTAFAPIDYVHAVREDPTRKGLLYAGTQHGVYISYDDGDHWQSLSLNLPDVPVSDIWVEANSIAIATHGRSFYILDDIAPLRQAGHEHRRPIPTCSSRPTSIRGAGAATISYLLQKPAEKMTHRNPRREGADRSDHPGGSRWSRARPGRRCEVLEVRRCGARLHRCAAAGAQPAAADRRTIEAVAAADADAVVRRRRRWPRGSIAPPGISTTPARRQFPRHGPVGRVNERPDGACPAPTRCELTVDGKSQTQPLVIRKHPLRNTPDADLQQQFNLALQIRDKASEANNAVIQIRKIKDDVKDRLTKSQDPQLKAAGERLTKNLSAVEEDLYQVRNQSGQDPLNFPIKTNNRLASLLGMTLRGEGKPTANIYPIFEDLKKELKAETDRLEETLTTDLASFNTEAKRAGVETIGGTVPPGPPR